MENVWEMIVDQQRKINRKLWRFRACFPPKGSKPLLWIRITIVLTLFSSLCLVSSAQETAKTKPKSRKFRSGLNQFVKLGQFEDNQITESSGVVMASPEFNDRPESAFWTLNDSGGKAVLYRVGLTGLTETKLAIKGATNRDWESMCSLIVDGKRYLAVGDVGDNGKRHPSCKVYLVEEPDFKPNVDGNGKPVVQDLTAAASVFEFTYEDGPNNCEAMGYNSEDNTFWFVEKVYVDNRRKKPPGIYVLPDPMKKAKEAGVNSSKNIARRVADLPIRNVTGMAFSDDNKKLVIRTYFGCFLYEKKDGKTWLETVNETELKSRALPLQTQGEAICFFKDANSMLLTSELKGAFIWEVRLDSKKRRKVKKAKQNE